jgi:hypothetical protein
MILFKIMNVKIFSKNFSELISHIPDEGGLDGLV